MIKKCGNALFHLSFFISNFTFPFSLRNNYFDISCLINNASYLSSLSPSFSSLASFSASPPFFLLHFLPSFSQPTPTPRRPSQAATGRARARLRPLRNSINGLLVGASLGVGGGRQLRLPENICSSLCLACGRSSRSDVIALTRSESTQTGGGKTAAPKRRAS